MKLLITGGAGFIGSNFIRYWLKKYPSDEIINFDKLTYAGNLDSLKDVENLPGYKFKEGDIANIHDVSEVIRGVDVLVNFAAESHVDRSILDPAPFVLTNVLGTQILLDAARKEKIRRFHHVSTDEVFGALALTSKEKFDETTKYQPNSPYSATKAASDHLVRAYFETYGLPITISNCSNNFGPYQYPEKLISLTITNLIEGKNVPVYGDGLYVRDWLYVEDHASSIDAIIQKGKVGETYCVGVNNDIPNISVIKRILKIMKLPETKIEYVRDRPGHDRRYAINAAKIKKELNWESNFSFDEALKLTISWYQNNKSWWKELKNKAFNDYYDKQYIRK